MKKIRKKCTALVLLSMLMLIGAQGIALAALPEAELERLQGVVGEELRITVTTGDAKGMAVAVGANYTVSDCITIVSAKPDDAKVRVVFSKNDATPLTTKGQAEMRVSSDQPGDVTIAMLLKFEDKENPREKSIFKEFNIHFQTPAEAAAASRIVTLLVGTNAMLVDGKLLSIDAASFVEDSRLYVPVRTVAEAFEAEVEFNAVANEIIITKGATEIHLQLGSPIMMINGQPMIMDVVAFTIGEGRTVVPAEFIAEALGYRVETIENQNGLVDSITFRK